VSFAYTRYIVNKVTLGRIGELGDGPTPSAGENALSSLFESAKQSLINDKSAPVFAEPKTFLEKFGSGRTLPDRINSDIA
jgi:hypothetical protein